MLPPGQNDGPSSKCLFTITELPQLVNHEQPPSKKRPFSTILGQTWTHTLDVLLPGPAGQKLQESLVTSGIGKLNYAKVFMKLSEVIEGEFFNQYIKTGNILMLYRGRAGIDPTYTLSEGILRLEVDKATFQRAGLQGKPIASEGRKHVKARYAIELNLRLPSMVRGKNGFDRVVWAFKNVLNETVTWLFHDLRPSADGVQPIAVHQPLLREKDADVQRLLGVEVPSFPHDMDEEDYETAAETLGWLSLATLMSPRLEKGDTMDPYLSRYRAPKSAVESKSITSTTQDLTRFRWYGLIPPTFAHKIVLTALKAAGDQWLGVSASSSIDAYTILFTQGKSLEWRYHD